MNDLVTINDQLQDIDLDDEQAGLLSNHCHSMYVQDMSSIEGWRREVEEIRKMAAQESEEKTFPWPKASNVKYPLITTSALQFNARAFPVIVNDSNIALIKVIGNDNGTIIQTPQGPMLDPNELPPGFKQARADRVSAHMNFQITEEMDNWDGEMDQLLLSLPIDGVAFKKTYWSDDKPVSEFINALDLVVNNYTQSLKTCPCISHVFSLYPYEILNKINSGEWIDYDDLNLDDDPIDFVEQHTRYDLDDDDYPEPLIVTFRENDGRIMNVEKNYDDSTSTYVDGELVKIEPLEYFTDYHFLPDPEGKFYSRGFGHLLKYINESVDGVLNRLLDAGTLANVPGGFLAKGFRAKSGTVDMEPGKWHKIDTGGFPLKDSVLPNPTKEPSMVLFTLLGFLVDAGKEIASIQDVMTGGGGKNQPATTTLAMIEQGMTVYNAIFRRVYRGVKEELRKIYKLNGKYLRGEQYVKVLDESVTSEDYELDTLDIMPGADPSMATDMQKTAKSQVLMQYLQFPFMNAQKIVMESLKTAGFSDPEQYLAPQQGPSPEEMIEQAKLQLEYRKQDQVEWDSQFENASKLATALEKIADTDEKGANNTSNALEIYWIMEQLRNAENRKAVQGMEGGANPAMGLPQIQG